MIFIIGSSVYEIFRNAICCLFHSRKGFSNSGIHMKKTLLAAGAVLALSSSFTVNAAENDKPQYLSDWCTRALTLSEAITPVSDRSSATIPTLSTKHSLKKTGSTSMVMRMRRYSSAVTPMLKVSGTTVLRCLWKSNRVSPSTS